MSNPYTVQYGTGELALPLALRLRLAVIGIRLLPKPTSAHAHTGRQAGPPKKQRRNFSPPSGELNGPRWTGPTKRGIARRALALAWHHHGMTWKAARDKKNFVRRSRDCGRGEFHERGAIKQNRKKVHAQTYITPAQAGRGEASPKGKGKGKGKWVDPDPRLRFGSSPARTTALQCNNYVAPCPPPTGKTPSPHPPDKARIPTGRLQRTAPSVFGLIIVNYACLASDRLGQTGNGEARRVAPAVVLDVVASARRPEVAGKDGLCLARIWNVRDDEKRQPGQRTERERTSGYGGFGGGADTDVDMQPVDPVRAENHTESTEGGAVDTM
ncbi:hypothetical protein BC827DRAFT_1157863 [Russula dissimulans]|nr:hypothetical protein BC827DRAFT_1157863 [Russula dissimulans]